MATLTRRFARAFYEGLWKTLADDIFTIIVSFCGALFFLFRSLQRYGWSFASLKQNSWEGLTVFIWVVSAIVSWHGIRAALATWKEIKEERQREATPSYLPILSESGEPIPVTQIKEPYSYVALKLSTIAFVLLAICALVSYVMWSRNPPVVIDRPVSTPPMADQSTPEISAGSLSEHRGHGTRDDASSLRTRGLKLAREMVAFLSSRDRATPVSTPRDTRRYELETLAMFLTKFGPPIGEFNDEMENYCLQEDLLKEVSDPMTKIYMSPEGMRRVAATVGNLSTWLPREVDYVRMSDRQVAELAIARAQNMNAKVNRATSRMQSGADGSPSATRAFFFNDFHGNDLEVVRDLRGVVVRRIGAAACDSDELHKFKLFMAALSDPGQLEGSVSWVSWYAPYLDSLGRKLEGESGAAQSSQREQKAKVGDKPKEPKQIPTQDNSVHVDKGGKIEQKSGGPCSPNIVGGGNTVNCGPSQRSFTDQQGSVFHGDLVSTPPQHKLIVWARGGEESIRFMKQINTFVPPSWSVQLMQDDQLTDSDSDMEIWVHPGSPTAEADALLLQNAFSKAGLNVPIVTNSHQDNWKESAWLVIFAIKR